MRTLLMLVAILVACQAQADDLDSYLKERQEKQYGNCTVTTNPIIIGGMQTLYCRELEAEPSLTNPPTTKREALNTLLDTVENSLKHPAEISIRRSRKGYSVTFSPHGHELLKSHTKNGIPVPVTIQIYTGKVIWREVIPRSDVEMWGDTALIRDDDLALHLLDELARGQRLTFKVGSKSGSTPLNGAAAIEDFRRRIVRDPTNETSI